ncbi:DUF3013 family protein [Enterococcus columbae]|uniref:DUF3013 domain-containing protein n=1 Tax=Enterococcus columbae DSM 7374 = ATCC 51263 TaxID=1121865 RepID=S1MUL4_9ENTE|nr:DUF3013 family protein [Enterococcus columbae]EOT40589.1 hypothetical protein OMW_01451 [Enterococcus columbae DSM 7374 = ATCC 51263]EOW80365.1 hypothetical protein I568_02065 [Enterococcus columbae DSM 7374 = ATCC 51263]
MAKETMLTYLDQLIDQKITDYDVALDFDSRNHTIEIVVRLFAENKQHLALDDVEGNQSAEEMIEYEDGILLYNAQKSQFEEEYYLKTLPFTSKKGMQKAELAALVDYLQEILDQGQADLLDFLAEDSTQEVFALRFDEEIYAKKLAAYQEKLGQDYVSYPSY